MPRQKTTPPRPSPNRPLRPLLGLKPAPPPPPPIPEKTTFLSLPAELRIEIYTLAIQKVIIHITPLTTPPTKPETPEDTPLLLPRPWEEPHPQPRSPHPLLLATHQIRSEVQPLLITLCPIRASITDFDFSSLLTWLARIPPDSQALLAKNKDLTIMLCTTKHVPSDLPMLRKWLHLRADVHRAQPEWRYQGSPLLSKVANDLRRRVRRMQEGGKKKELKKIIRGHGVPVLD